MTKTSKKKRIIALKREVKELKREVKAEQEIARKCCEACIYLQDQLKGREA